MKERTEKKHLLTVLLEDYFQVGAFDRLIREQNWSRFEPRYVQNTLKTLDLLDRNDSRATFFVLGWIAEQTPDLIREIVARGHEIASRGYNHCPLSRMSPAEFRADLLRTRDILERAAGQRIIGHRAAEKLSYKTDLWTLDVLAEENFAYDASFLPTRSTVKNARYRRFAHEHNSGERKIWEFPYSTVHLSNLLIPISGGNYFRQIPYTLLRRGVENWHKESNAPFVLYFHVWELDTEQPRINAASTYNRIRHYRKLDKMAWILNENLSRYNFTSAAEYLKADCRLQTTQSSVLNREPLTVDAQLQNNAPGRAADAEQLTTDKSKIQNPKSKITVVVPCYNEEKSLPYLANTLKSLENSLRYDLSFIFVDDNSRDNTFTKLNELFGKQANAQVLRHETNRGVAAGIMTGLKAAKTEIVCSIDADCTYDPHELARMIPLLDENTALVTASPYHPAGGVRNVPSWRLGLSRGASWLYQNVLQADLHTFTSCFRVYRRSVAAEIELRENGFLGVAEMLGKIYLAGGRVVEHPAVLEVRLFGFSKMKTARTVAGHLKLLARLSSMRRHSKRISAAPPTETQPAEKLIAHKSLSKF